MKAHVLFGVPMLLSLPSTAAAVELPSRIRADLDQNVAGCTFQLHATRAYDRLNSDADFKRRIQEALHHVGRLRSLSSQQLGVGLVTAASGAGSFRYAYMTGGKARLLYLPAAFAFSTTSSMGFFIAKTGGELRDVKWSLNQGRLDEFSTKVASSYEKVLGLSKDEVQTLKGAISNAVRAKAKAKDDNPIDIFQILNAAKFKGQSILSDEEKRALAEIETIGKSQEAPAAGSPPVTDDEKIGFLEVCSAILKTYLAEKPGDQIALKASADYESYLTLVSDFRKLHAAPAAAGGEAETAEEPTLDK